MALAVSSVSSEAPSQLSRSTSASNGLAEPCTPLSPTSGFATRPSAAQSCMICQRIEPTLARSGSVAPSTSPRNSAHDISDESHSTEK